MNESGSGSNDMASLLSKILETQPPLETRALAGLPPEAWFVLLSVCLVVCIVGASVIREIRKRRKKANTKRFRLSLVSLIAGLIVGVILCLFVGQEKHPPLSELEFQQVCARVMVFSSFAGVLQAIVIHLVCEQRKVDLPNPDSPDQPSNPVV